MCLWDVEVAGTSIRDPVSPGHWAGLELLEAAVTADIP